MSGDVYGIRMVFEPDLRDTILITGLPGIGNVGKIVADMFIRSFSAKCFAELYSPYFSDSVIVDHHGLSHLPRYEFYTSPLSDPNVIILTGDTQPMFEYGKAYYEINDASLDLAQHYGCKLVVTLGGIPSKKKGEIYIAATSNKLPPSLGKDQEPKRYEGRIVGGAGLLIGLAKLRGLNAVSMLVTSRPFTPDKKAASTLYDFVLKAFDVKKVKI